MSYLQASFSLLLVSVVPALVACARTFRTAARCVLGTCQNARLYVKCMHVSLCVIVCIVDELTAARCVLGTCQNARLFVWCMHANTCAWLSVFVHMKKCIYSTLKRANKNDRNVTIQKKPKYHHFKKCHTVLMKNARVQKNVTSYLCKVQEAIYDAAMVDADDVPLFIRCISSHASNY